MAEASVLWIAGFGSEGTADAVSTAVTAFADWCGVKVGFEIEFEFIPVVVAQVGPGKNRMVRGGSVNLDAILCCGTPDQQKRHAGARYPSGKGEVRKTFIRQFDSGPRLQR